MILPNQYGTDGIQNELLEIMKIFHEFCEQHSIKYSLYGGSCLGAVRHNGFIPWDDDLDICVDRTNYNKLLEVFDQCKTLKMFQNLWIKRIQKADAIIFQNYIPTLDIFVIDNAPDKKISFLVKNFRLAILQGMLKENVDYKGYSFINKILVFITHFLGKFFPKNLLHKWYDSVSQIGNNIHTTNVHCTNTSYRWIYNIYPSDTWDKVILMGFEDSMFYIPSKYNSYLSICYGDYMKLPDEKHRIPEHAKPLEVHK